MQRLSYIITFALLFSLYALAADKPSLVYDWPPQAPHTLHLEFGKFVRTSIYAKQNNYTVDVLAQNVSSSPIVAQSFDLYVFDKHHVRIGEGYFVVRDLAPGQKTIQPMTLTTTGTPVTMELQAAKPRVWGTGIGEISLLVNTTPSGAELKLDGQSVGTSPKTLKLSVGHHDLEASHPGYRDVQYPIEADATLNGGRIDLELGTTVHDTLELRDGSIVSGDILSMDADKITISVAGQNQTIERNRVSRILLVQRLPVSQ